MSDGSTEGRQASSGLHAAQAETDLVRAEADTARDVAISQAAHRDAAELVARNAAYIRDATERAQLNAKLRADQERAAASVPAQRSSILRARLLSERKAASKATFGLIIAAVLLIIGCIAGGIYYFSSQGSAANSASVGATPGVLASTNLPANSSDVSGPGETPAANNGDSASGHDETAVQPESTDHKPPVSGAIGGIAPGALTDAKPSAESRNFSGAALNNEGAGSAGGLNAPKEGILTTPGNDAETGLGSKSSHP